MYVTTTKKKKKSGSFPLKSLGVGPRGSLCVTGYIPLPTSGFPHVNRRIEHDGIWKTALGAIAGVPGLFVGNSVS